ncbi:MAG TPA: A/G-specific adenine glycosylase [Lutibacter sp.]|nr:A/G-specific adenine glycosylase [Lutibacter sp.]
MNNLERNFSHKIIAWYLINRRDLPWRNTNEPYKIWLSEIILQQTRVAQGLPYYLKFIKTFPTLQDLAKAEEQAVLKLWQGLGYYSRARNMHHTAQYIFNELNGKFPETYKDLLQLKGVGDYTASAISSFCYSEVQPVVDGNVYRVLARYFGITTPINTNKAKKEFKDIAFELIDPDKPSMFNQAIMEFGSLQCTPKNPKCEVCPFNDACVTLQTNQIGVLPIKESKLKIKKRFFNYLVVETEDQKTLVNQRMGKGIWQNLYEFPLIETEKEFDYLKLIEHADFNSFIGVNNFNLKLLTPKSIIHKLSHQHLHIRFWSLNISSSKEPTSTWEEVLKLPFPIVIFSFIEEFLRKKE